MDNLIRIFVMLLAFCLLPVPVCSGHCHNGVRSPATNKHEENCEGNLRNSDLDALARILLVASQRFNVHLLRLLL